MTLIDKEHLWSFLKMYQYDQTSEEKQNAVLGCIELLEQEKEVEAIPVEWLLNHIPHDEQMERYNKKLIEYLVIGWREENE